MLVWSHSICIQNLSSIGPMVPEIQNKGDLTFDLHLHSQDGPHINLMLLCNMLVWSHSICIQNLGSIGPVVCEIQNKGEMCVWAYVRVCV